MPLLKDLRVHVSWPVSVRHCMLTALEAHDFDATRCGVDFFVMRLRLSDEDGLRCFALATGHALLNYINDSIDTVCCRTEDIRKGCKLACCVYGLHGT